MKQFALRSLGLGVTFITLIQLPVLASNRVLTGSVESAVTLEPQLLAQVGLTTQELRPGDQGANVRALQRYLSQNGLYPFEIDGVYGPRTSDYVAVYQRMRDLPATGVADRETLSDMGFEFLPNSQANSSFIPLPPSSSGAAVGAGILAPGSRGADVVALQQRLSDFGLPVAVDGVYGFETQQAVRTYQRVQGLTVTGNADAQTLNALGFSSTTPTNRYIAAIIADGSQLATVQTFFEDAYVDRDRRGQFINIGNFAERFPAEARVDAAQAVGFNTRVLYRRRGLF